LCGEIVKRYEKSLTMDELDNARLVEFYYIGSAEGHEYPDLQVGMK
jgi:hypothetical protein